MESPSSHREIKTNEAEDFYEKQLAKRMERNLEMKNQECEILRKEVQIIKEDLYLLHEEKKELHERIF